MRRAGVNQTRRGNSRTTQIFDSLRLPRNHLWNAAIGEQLSPVHGVLWLAETVAQYEVRQLAGFRSFRPDVQPDRDFDVVR